VAQTELRSMLFQKTTMSSASIRQATRSKRSIVARVLRRCAPRYLNPRLARRFVKSPKLWSLNNRLLPANFERPRCSRDKPTSTGYVTGSTEGVRNSRIAETINPPHPVAFPTDFLSARSTQPSQMQRDSLRMPVSQVQRQIQNTAIQTETTERPSISSIGLLS
jgi:hypothetical protein